MTYHWVCHKSNTTGANSGAGTAYPCRAPKFIFCFKWRSYCSFFSFLCSALHIIVCPFVLFLFWSLYCLFFCGLWLLLTPLASSHFPYHGTILVVTISLESSNTSRSQYIRLSYHKQKIMIISWIPVDPYLPI